MIGLRELWYFGLSYIDNRVQDTRPNSDDPETLIILHAQQMMVCNIDQELKDYTGKKTVRTEQFFAVN